MVNEVKTYGNGNWLTYQNANATVTENQKHGVAKNYKAENDTAYNTFDKLLKDDNDNSDVTIFVSDRTEKNNQGKALAGLSYDLADMFMKAAAEGWIKDNDGQGFKRDNAVALGEKIAELDGKQKNYMDDSFRTMGAAKKPKDHRTYTRAEIFELMEAAGYSRAKAPEPKQEVKQSEPPKQEEVKKPEVKPQPEGNEKYSQNGKYEINQAIKALGIDEGKICIDVKGKLAQGKHGGYVKKETVKVADEHGQNAEKVKIKVTEDGTVKAKKGGFWSFVRKYREVGSTNPPAQEAAQEVEGAK